ncbi:hypothetical protein EJ05DRAFT_509546 [Pseudovirgaria hyperparasitica]|uniref:Uncharacterized protein n=1 Tax=Pseudovirgaria hyperparasitica TaxID=470096 RepID=A0A6A6WAG9_9PEZI|nr:uncharacterized protein EJ05DRAFT_509546 [Pseudovirgaria hyperparasitica]KAF2759858.1 hypothetical protein EJ05DRAFT_509546 [Pseudovirgaria hyperparasitica]
MRPISSYKSLKERIFMRWLSILKLPRQSDLSWHQNRLHEEVEELHEAQTRLEKYSETSDVIFLVYRARHDGFDLSQPQFNDNLRPSLVHLYMVAKYTSRYGFYKMTAWLCKSGRKGAVNEVTNASKDEKLEAVARRHEMDVQEFVTVARRLRRIWPLFP